MIAVLKLGHTYKGLSLKRGDFEHWVMAGLGLGSDKVNIIDVAKGDPLPLYNRLAGVILTGSHVMVTNRLPWSERVASWIPGAIERAVPLLGICYGHQLLAYALGGRVDDNPHGKEIGMVEVTLHANAHKDRLLGGIGNPIRVYCCHSQSVLELPPGAKRLAASSRDSTQAFSIDRCAWGVQFHPEFDAEITSAYIRHHHDGLILDGQDPQSLMAGCQDTPYGPLILRRFAGIVKDRDWDRWQ
jgi:GMP synthase (glutamine-hydrolysing)